MDDLTKEKLKAKEYLDLYNKSLGDIEKLENDLYFREHEEEQFIADNVRELEEISDKEKIDYFNSKYPILKYKLLELYNNGGLNYDDYISTLGDFEIFAKQGKNIYDFINKKNI